MEYFYSTSNQQQGPVSPEQLRALNLPGDTLVWREGFPQWQRLDSIPDFAPTSPAPAYAPVPQPVKVMPVAGAPTGPLAYQPLGPTTHTNGMAIAALVTGIFSLVTLFCYLIGFIPGVLAIIFGVIARKQIRRGEGQGNGMATAGLICGSISVGLIVVMFLVFFVIGLARAVHS